jgi:hypothetical protein
MRTAVATLAALALCAPAAGAAPVITPQLEGTAGDNGWFISNVRVSWTEAESTPGWTLQSTSGCDLRTLTADTPPSGTTLTCSAMSTGPGGASATVTQPVTVFIDRVAPSGLAVATDRPPDVGSWFNHPVGVAWTGSDGGSGIASCTSVPYGGPDTASATLSGTCTDRAGNVSAALPFSLSYDATPPTLTGLGAQTAEGRATLTWQAAGATSFTVVRSPGAGDAASSLVYSGAAATFTDTGLVVGRTYDYRVQAVDPAGNAASAAIAVTLTRLVAPAPRARMTAPPLLRWNAIRAASYYNVQLFRNGRKILSAWPTRARYQVRSVWRYRGHRHRLVPGTYRWYLWAGYGKRSQNRYGKLLGSRSFNIVRG